MVSSVAILLTWQCFCIDLYKKKGNISTHIKQRRHPCLEWNTRRNEKKLSKPVFNYLKDNYASYSTLLHKKRNWSETIWPLLNKKNRMKTYDILPRDYDNDLLGVWCNSYHKQRQCWPKTKEHTTEKHWRSHFRSCLSTIKNTLTSKLFLAR